MKRETKSSGVDRNHSNYINLLATHRVAIKQPGAVTVVGCLHRFDPRNEPRHINCPRCWNAYFQLNDPVFQAAQDIVQSLGIDALKDAKGKKFVKHFDAYRLLWEQYKQVTEQLEQSTEKEQKLESVREDESGTEASDAVERGQVIRAEHASEAGQ